MSRLFFTQTPAKRLPLVALALTVMVIAVPLATPAQRASAQAAAGADSLGGSIAAGTFESDVLAGTISIDQLTSLYIEAKKSLPTPDGPDVDYESARRDIEQEVRAAQDGRLAPAQPTILNIDTDPSQGFSLSEDHSEALPEGWGELWGHLSHWTTWHLSSTTIKLILSSGGALSAGLICALPGINAVACAFAGALVAFLSTSAVLGLCTGVGVYVTIPDVKNSYCG
ncbi:MULTISPECIES: hypothetical protein [unclassified Rathayibacter]|uniref:hypothetical protein n=1 Tax=unclassified Rathayibacter TaxID=2609250 RepID=UPI00188B8B92|nr:MULTISPECIES: hypothetical protein [unclassified Rathayibacter]MBF4502554.1 hypothetical protein [Rathayibacter sp. VKM Ac-2878]